jgi:arsenate reductase (thioredoxin)
MRILADGPFNVLFISTRNAVRSIIAEAVLGKLGTGKFRAYSAGAQPSGLVHPETIQLLQGLGYDTSACRSKSWREFAMPGATPLDFVFAIFDPAAGENDPIWPGQPITAHWDIPNPALTGGSPAKIAFAFRDSFRMLYQRIGIFTALPPRSLDQLSLQKNLTDLARAQVSGTNVSG